MPQIKHVHKLKRHRFKSGSVVFFCALDCTYKISPALAEGKRSICWRCGEEFIMNEYSIRLTKPHCEGCHKPKDMNKIDKTSFDSETTNINPLTIHQKDISVEPLSGQPLSLNERLQAAIKGTKKDDKESEEDI